MDDYSKETLRRIERDDTLNELGICNTDQVVSSDGRYFTSTDEDDYSRLGSCIGNNTQVQTLYVQLQDIGLSATDSGFFEGIKQNSSINKFKLNGFSTFLPDGDDFIRNPVGYVGCELLKAFQNKNNLTFLRIWSCDIGSIDDRVIINNTLSSCTNLKTIYLNHNSITGEQLLPMVEAIRGHPSLKRLCLSYNRIGNVGCVALGTLLEDPNCKFEELNIIGNNINDEGAMAIANSLANNTKLKELNLGRNDQIGRSIVDVFSSLLCDTSDMNDIHSSNHTLQKLVLPTSSGIGADLRSLLFSNESTNKKHVAIKKILRYHPNIGMEQLFEWGSKDERNVMALPYVIDWFVRAEEAVGRLRPYSKNLDQRDLSFKKLSAIYQFALAMPLMFIPSSHINTDDKKRKRVSI